MDKNLFWKIYIFIILECVDSFFISNRDIRRFIQSFEGGTAHSTNLNFDRRQHHHHPHRYHHRHDQHAERIHHKPQHQSTEKPLVEISTANPIIDPEIIHDYLDDFDFDRKDKNVDRSSKLQERETRKKQSSRLIDHSKCSLHNHKSDRVSEEKKTKTPVNREQKRKPKPEHNHPEHDDDYYDYEDPRHYHEDYIERKSKNKNSNQNLSAVLSKQPLNYKDYVTGILIQIPQIKGTEHVGDYYSKGKYINPFLETLSNDSVEHEHEHEPLTELISKPFTFSDNFA